MSEISRERGTMSIIQIIQEIQGGKSPPRFNRRRGINCRGVACNAPTERIDDTRRRFPLPPLLGALPLKPRLRLGAARFVQAAGRFARARFIAPVFIFVASALGAQSFDLTGLINTELLLGAGAGKEMPDLMYGAEEYANLRLTVKTDGPATFYGALNLIALSGYYTEYENGLSLLSVGAASANAQDIPTSILAAGDYFAAMLEIERLYVHLHATAFDVDLGLFRQAFGLGQVWSPMDFINTKNPLQTDVRPKPSLGLGCTFYPADNSKLTAFAAAPKNPFNMSGQGFLSGLAFNQHWKRLDLETLYAYETPQDGIPPRDLMGYKIPAVDATRDGLHRIGLSIRTDLVVELILESLYTLNTAATNNTDGLSASASVDYSFFSGDLYLASSYLFSGSKSSTSFAQQPQMLEFSKNNYLYASALYNFTDYTNTGLAAVVCLDDASFEPIITAQTSPFQGFTLSMQALIPLDEDTLTGNGKQGSLGPANTGSHFELILTAQYRF